MQQLKYHLVQQQSRRKQAVSYALSVGLSSSRCLNTVTLVYASLYVGAGGQIRLPQWRTYRKDACDD